MNYLQGGDLRSVAKVNQLLSLIKSQQGFDELFRYLHAKDRLIVMRAADAIEKIPSIKARIRKLKLGIT